jgi:hypothetical protein
MLLHELHTLRDGNERCCNLAGEVLILSMIYISSPQAKLCPWTLRKQCEYTRGEVVGVLGY